MVLSLVLFYTVQLFTYQQAFMTNFSVVSARLEVEFLASQQRMREAFSNAEGAAAKKMHKELEDLQEVCYSIDVLSLLFPFLPPSPSPHPPPLSLSLSVHTIPRIFIRHCIFSENRTRVEADEMD